MPIIIKFERRVIRGQKKVVVLKCLALREEQLPVQYITDFTEKDLKGRSKPKPWCTFSEYGIKIRYCIKEAGNKDKWQPEISWLDRCQHPSSAQLSSDGVFSEEKFQELIDLLEACGDHLREVNAKIKRQTKDWHDTETVEI